MFVGSGQAVHALVIQHDVVEIQIERLRRVPIVKAEYGSELEQATTTNAPTNNGQ
jgi:hypothetical protein